MSGPAAQGAIVSSDWLLDRLKDDDVVVLNATWYLPTMKRDAAMEFNERRITSSKFFDIDGVARLDVPLPHMLPSEDQFARAADALGISNNTTVVLYDNIGTFSSPRAWWTFKVFGHDRVHVLDGGLPQWVSRGLPVDEGPVAEEELTRSQRAAQTGGAAPPPSYQARLDTSKVVHVGQLMQMMRSGGQGDLLVVDARSEGRFNGVEPEPRAGLRSGHMPGSKNVPFFRLLREGFSGYKSPSEIAEAFQSAEVDLAQPWVASCGSGLTACVLALGAYQVNGQLVPVYDGSWMEWASTEGASIVP